MDIPLYIRYVKAYQNCLSLFKEPQMNPVRLLQVQWLKKDEV